MNGYARRILHLSLLAVLCFLVADRMLNLSSRLYFDTQYVRETLMSSKGGLPREIDPSVIKYTDNVTLLLRTDELKEVNSITNSNHSEYADINALSSLLRSDIQGDVYETGTREYPARADLEHLKNPADPANENADLTNGDTYVVGEHSEANFEIEDTNTKSEDTNVTGGTIDSGISYQTFDNHDDPQLNELNKTHAGGNNQREKYNIIGYITSNRNKLSGNRAASEVLSRTSKSNGRTPRLGNVVSVANNTNKLTASNQDTVVEEMSRKISVNAKHRQTNKDAVSSRTLDFISQKQGFYRRIRDYVSENKTFPWHLVDREYLLQNLGIEEYSKTRCVKGSPFEPLPDYKSPCWMQRTTNVSVEYKNLSLNGVNYTMPVNKHSNTTVDKLACMPSIFLAGFPKCGTSDLFTSLTSHHQIQPGNTKEPNFWTKHSAGDFEGYIQKFDKVAKAISNQQENYVEKDQDPILTVDGTPSNIWLLPVHRSWKTQISYIQKYIAPLSILAVQPQAKVIIITRNPTDRTISHYKHMNKLQTDKVMYHAVKKAVAELEECFKTHTVRHCAYHPHYTTELHDKVRLRTGLYAAFLQDLLDLFPRDQIFIIKGEDYYHNRTDVMEQVFQFLDVDPLTDEIISHLKGNSVTNKGSQKGRVLKIVDRGLWTDKTKDLLNHFFKPFNVQLSKLLRDPRYLSWNKN